MTIRVPRIHLNGTHESVLAHEYSAAIVMIDAAIAKMLNITVHGRDYYTESDHAYQDALREHRARLAMLNDVRDELQQIYASILEQSAQAAERRWSKTSC